MQKFKIDREKLLEGLNGSKTGFIYNLLELPYTIILEGELLEGGTSEKCCTKCYEVVGRASRKMCGDILCGCHIHFNRETTKCCCEGRIKPPASHSLNGCVTISKDEVKLPEPIDDNVDTDWKLALKINQIIEFLASKENK